MHMYEVTLNGKPVRETNGELVGEEAMKVAVITVQLQLVKGDDKAYSHIISHGDTDHSFVVHHHGGIDIIDAVKRS